MKKKIFNFFIIFILVFSIFTPVSANTETLEKNKNSKEIIIIPIENYQDKESFEIEIGNISNYNNNNELSRSRYGKTILKASVSRSGKTDNCEVYLHWNGPDRYNAWSFSRIDVENGSFLHYKNFGPIYGKTIETDGSTMGSVKLGAVSIPYTQKNVILRFSNLKGYNMNRGYWLSADLHPGLVGIK
ncbi:hypothetical protein ACQRC6_09590 [Peptoniphilus sp. SGI.035]|uniref:hypothetical protein n=1 Tax=Peptoniphilus sp. SGI.035 TaxID=3420564 RepID=UPI003CFFDEF9